MAAGEGVPQPKLRAWVWIVGIGGAVVVVSALVALPTLIKMIPLPSLPLSQEQEAPVGVAKLPQEYSKPALTYGAPVEEKPAIVEEQPMPTTHGVPVAQYTQRGGPGTVSQSSLEERIVVQNAAILDALKGLVPGQRQNTAPVEERPAQTTQTSTSTTPQASTPVQRTSAGKDEKKKKTWEYLAQPSQQAQAQTVESPGSELGKKKDLAADPNDLIHRAKWSVPQSPLKTIYRSQTMTGRLLQAMSSDVPGGQVKIQLTTPVLDRFGYDTTIVPKDSIVIATMQEQQVRYGQSRLKITLEQLEFPSGEVVTFKATIGDQDGANGMPGKVNNHLGKLVLATGLSAVLNIGVRAGAGTPGPGSYFQNPVQSAAQDIGQSVQRDTQSIVDRELRIPPTITVNAGTFCSINLSENIQFNHAPAVVR